MGHVTFVHGIGPGVTSSLVSWADLLYAAPAPAEAAHESTTLELEAAVSPSDANLSWLATASPQEHVCGFDREIAPDFRREGRKRVRDVGVINHGSWRHSIGTYLGQPALRLSLLDALR